jgi:predicted secreted protein
MKNAVAVNKTGTKEEVSDTGADWREGRDINAVRQEIVEEVNQIFDEAEKYWVVYEIANLVRDDVYDEKGGFFGGRKKVESGYIKTFFKGN